MSGARRAAGTLQDQFCNPGQGSSAPGCIIAVLRLLAVPGLLISRAMQLQGYISPGLHIPGAAPAAGGGMREHWRGCWRNITWARLSGPVSPAL